MSSPILPGQDIIDSRDVIERLIELRDGPDLDIAEYNALRELDREGEENSEDWEYGATLVHEAYFVQYAQELADDIGAFADARGAMWPYTHIDWDSAAEELKQDYTILQFGGQTYYVR